MSAPPYQVNQLYLLNSVVKKLQKKAESFGGMKDYFTVVTNFGDDRYRITFRKNGESPNGKVVKCVLITLIDPR